MSLCSRCPQFALCSNTKLPDGLFRAVMFIIVMNRNHNEQYDLVDLLYHDHFEELGLEIAATLAILRPLKATCPYFA